MFRHVHITEATLSQLKGMYEVINYKSTTLLRVFEYITQKMGITTFLMSWDDVFVKLLIIFYSFLISKKDIFYSAHPYFIIDIIMQNLQGGITEFSRPGFSMKT